jgi:nucleoid-associated protein YgaU
VGDAPIVRHFDVQTYRCKPEDQSFSDLSKKFYHSERYAQALLLYNRTHPLVDEGVRHEPPELRPGAPVFIPPLELLEEHHGSAIPGLKPLPQIPASGTVTVGSSSPAPGLGGSGAIPVPPAPGPSGLVPVPAVPVPAVAAPTPPANVVPANAWAAAGKAEKVYRVPPGNGEPLYLIARKTLGDGQRWSEIYGLNPSVRADLPIPPGTVLMMPADARLDP